MMDYSPIVLSAVGMIGAFFFGKSGILQKGFDFVLGEKKKTLQSYIDIIAVKDKQIAELETLTDKLQETCAKYEMQLAKNSIYTKTMLCYMETVIPEGANSFITEMIREIRDFENSK